LQAEVDRVVGGGVAGMQRRDDVDALWQFGSLRRRSRREVQKAHALEAQPLRKGARFFDEFGARFYAINPPPPKLFEIQVVEDETQVRLARAMVGQRGAVHGIVAVLGAVLQQRLDEVEQVIDLLELAPRVLVEPPFAREDVQLMQQRDRLPGAQFGRIEGCVCGAPALGWRRRGFALRPWYVHGVILHRAHAAAVAPTPRMRSRRCQSSTDS